MTSKIKQGSEDHPELDLHHSPISYQDLPQLSNSAACESVSGTVWSQFPLDPSLWFLLSPGQREEGRRKSLSEAEAKQESQYGIRSRPSSVQGTPRVRAHTPNRQSPTGRQEDREESELSPISRPKAHPPIIPPPNRGSGITSTLPFQP